MMALRKSPCPENRAVDPHRETDIKRRARSAPLSRAAKPAHKAVARMTLDTLHLAHDEGLRAFWGLAVVLRTRLSSSERQGLAWAALMACDDDEAQGIAEAVLGPPNGAGGPPLPPFNGVLEEAVFWAGMADEEELRAYVLACFSRLPPAARSEFLGFATRRAAA